MSKKNQSDSRYMLDRSWTNPPVESPPHERFNQTSHWITEQINSGMPFGIKNKILTGFIKFGLIWDLLAGIYLVTQWGEISLLFLGSSALFLIWVNLAPFFIWYYDEHVMPGFFAGVTEIIIDQDRLDDLSKEYGQRFATFNPFHSLLWGSGFLAGSIFSTSIFQSQGMVGDGWIFLWITYIFYAYVGAVLGEAGFSAVVTTNKVVRRIADLEFHIEPFHPDGRGGLSNIGFYAIRTTMLWSTASLLIPIAFRLISESSFNATMIFFVSLYIGTILFSFFYPTLVINRKGEELRKQILEEIREKYSKIQQGIEEKDDNEILEISKQLKLQRLRNEYEDYNQVQLYPIRIGILTQLFGSVLLPLFFLFLEYYFIVPR